MKFRMIAASVLTLGVSAMVVTPAMADARRDDRRDDHRDDRGANVRHDAPRTAPIRYTAPIRVEQPRFDAPRFDAPRFDPVVRVERDFDRNVNLCDVPARVIETINCEAKGRPIEAVQYVSRDGKLFYRFRVDRRLGTDVNLRVSVDGRLLSVQDVGDNCP